MYYGTILLEKVGLGESGSLYANILIGAVSVIATILGTRLIENPIIITCCTLGYLETQFSCAYWVL